MVAWPHLENMEKNYSHLGNIMDKLLLLYIYYM